MTRRGSGRRVAPRRPDRGDLGGAAGVSSRRWSAASASGGGCTTRSSRPSATARASSSRCSASRASASRGSCRSSSAIWPASALVARGRCLPYGEGITFWPLLEAVKEAVGLDESDSPERGPREARRRASGPRTMPSSSPSGWRRRSGWPRPAAGREEGFAAVRDALRGARAPTAARPRLRRHPLGRGRRSSTCVEHLADSVRESRRSCSSAWRGPSCSTCDPAGAAGKLNATTVAARAALRRGVQPPDREPRRRAGLADEVAAADRRAPPRATRSSSRRCSRC